MDTLRHTKRPSHQAMITAVAPASPAARAGIAPGDRLLAIGGEPVRDCVDYRFLSAEERVEVRLARPDGERYTAVIEKDPDDDLGLRFASDLFDGMRRCRNRCVFCFYDQLPPGLRPSLYVRDDDFRLSFLHGNFITLTNLGRGDLERIARQRLSPLYVSVHATDPDLRRRLLGNAGAPEVLPQLRWLAARGIELHAQVVLCPGLNDGPALERTVADLAALRPAIGSIAIVPVGLTAHRRELPPLAPVDAGAARALLRQVEAWQGEFMARAGSRLVYAADEFYVVRGEGFPPAAEYEGFPQRENGVGLARGFLDELEGADFRAAAGLRMTLLTGVCARSLVEALAQRMRAQGVGAQVAVVANRLLGESVTVAGLLAGADIERALRAAGAAGPHDAVALPSSALRDGEFLDGVRLRDLRRRLGVAIVTAAGPRELATKARRLARRISAAEKGP